MASTLASRTATLMVAAIATLSLSGCVPMSLVADYASKEFERKSQSQATAKPSLPDSQQDGALPDGAEQAEVTETDVYLLRVGDCLNAATEDTVYSVDIVPCANAHDDEAYFEGALSGTEYPGDEGVLTQANELCYQAFAGFVGMDYENSQLDFYPYMPTEQSWNESGDRLVTCIIYEPEVRTVGSLAGATR